MVAALTNNFLMGDFMHLPLKWLFSRSDSLETDCGTQYGVNECLIEVTQLPGHPEGSRSIRLVCRQRWRVNFLGAQLRNSDSSRY